MAMTRRTVLGAGLAVTTFGLGATGRGKAAEETIRIGHITDMSGIYRDVEGPTSVACTRQAIEEFTAANPGIRVELVVADHQNKPDVGLVVIRQWLDEGGIDIITNVGNSAIALGSRRIVEERDKVSIVTSAGSSDLTGKSCSPNLLHWSWDSWCLAHSTATAMVKTGGTKWFFVTADYAFGLAAQADATRFVQAEGGKVVGGVKYPYGSTTDFSSFLLQAQSSGANVVAFCNSGTDLITCLKQAQEFGVDAGGKVRLAATVGYITDVIAMGLPVAQGLSLTETFYWDLNDRTRAFTKRIAPKLPAGVFPNMSQAGDYSGVTHYLKAVKALGVAQAKASGRGVIAAMKQMPTDDDCFGVGRVREDGRKIHPAYLFSVKSPRESKGPGDIYKLVSTIPAEEAFRPISDGHCPYVRA